MSLTGIGVFVVLAVALGLTRGARGMLAVLILSSPLQAAVVLTFGLFDAERGLAVRYFVMAAFCAAVIFTWSKEKAAPRLVRASLWLAWSFCAYGILTAAVLPRLDPFESSLLVYRENGVFASNLPASTNLTHSLNLILCVLTFTCVSLVVSGLDDRRRRDLVRVFELACMIAVGFILWHLLSLYTGAWFPYSFFANNPAAMLVEEGRIRPDIGFSSPFLRPSGSFSEPSVAAAMLSGYLGLLLARFIGEKRAIVNMLKCLGICAVMLALTSTTGYAAAVLIAGWALLAGVLKTLTRGDIGQLVKPVSLILALACCWCAIVYAAPLMSEEISRALYYNVVDKIARDSGSRMAIEQFAAGLLSETYGLGVGLGGNVSFTLWGYLLSNIGVVGIALFTGLCATVALGCYRHSRRLRNGAEHELQCVVWMLGGYLACGMIGTQMLFEPMLWILLGTTAGWVGGSARQVAFGFEQSQSAGDAALSMGFAQGLSARARPAEASGMD